MNPIKIEIDKKIDGSETARDQYSNINNAKKFFNFPVSPRNKYIKSINLGNINAYPSPKHLSKGNSVDKVIKEDIKKIIKQNSMNNLNNSNYIRNTNKKILELDINNIKKLNESNNELLNPNIMINNKIKSILFQNNNKIKNSHNNNILLKAGQKIFNNIDKSNIKMMSGGEANKIDITSIMEIKNKPLIIKLDPKKISSYLKGKNNKEKVKNINNKNKDLFSKINDDEQEIKRIKTPTKKIFVESYRGKIKQSLSDFINIDKNIIDKNILDLNINKNNKIKKEKSEKLVPEENHFKAVIYSQEIKKFNKALE